MPNGVRDPLEHHGDHEKHTDAMDMTNGLGLKEKAELKASG